MKYVCALLVLCVSTTLADTDEFTRLLKQAADAYPASQARFDFAARQKADRYKPGLPGGFQCPALAPSATIPTDARFVRPSDVRVVAALGDSLTAANGAKAWTVPGVLQQYRGLSWSIGGDDDITKVLTMPNILKKYSPNLYGYSLGTSYGDFDDDVNYNVASAGDTAADMVGQSERLVRLLKRDGTGDLWKVITLFIGGNDVCEYCKEPELLSPENYKRNIQTAIDNLYTLKNTIVNLAGPLDMTDVVKLPDGFSCNAVHKGICGCVYDKADPTYATRMSHLYQQQARDIVTEASTRWTRSDFAVSFHPQFMVTELPMSGDSIDMSYFAPDCFHFSQKGHESSAIALWNNMMTPAEVRDDSLDFASRAMKCPDENAPYITI